MTESTPQNRTITRQDLQDAAPRVLARLQAVADLPSSGTVAGQAVASLFFEELGLEGLRGPVHDIDVFLNATTPRELRGREAIDEPEEEPSGAGPFGANVAFASVSPHRKVPLANQRESVTSIEHDGYTRIKFIARRNSIDLLSTYRNGIVNYTLLGGSRCRAVGGHGDGASLLLINGFDLNLVRIGINLNTGNVAVGRGFLEFLQDRAIKALTCNTPAHTLIRLATKMRDPELTGVHCDFPAQRAMLEDALSIQKWSGRCVDLGENRGWMLADDATLDDQENNAERSSQRGLVTRFGTAYKKKHDAAAGLLPPLQEVNGLFTLQAAGGRAQALLDAMGPRWLALFSVWGVARFPDMYDTLANPKCGEELKRLIQLQLDDEGDDEGNVSQDERGENRVARFFDLMHLLGDRKVTDGASGFDVDDLRLFFSDQTCSRDPLTETEALDLLEACGVKNGRWLIQNGLRADDFLALGGETLPEVVARALLDRRIPDSVMGNLSLHSSELETLLNLLRDGAQERNIPAFLEWPLLVKTIIADESFEKWRSLVQGWPNLAQIDDRQQPEAMNLWLKEKKTWSVADLDGLDGGDLVRLLKKSASLDKGGMRRGFWKTPPDSGLCLSSRRDPDIDGLADEERVKRLGGGMLAAKAAAILTRIPSGAGDEMRLDLAAWLLSHDDWTIGRGATHLEGKTVGRWAMDWISEQRVSNPDLWSSDRLSDRIHLLAENHSDSWWLSKGDKVSGCEALLAVLARGELQQIAEPGEPKGRLRHKI